MLEYHSDNSVSVINSSHPSIVSDREITSMQKDLRAAVVRVLIKARFPRSFADIFIEKFSLTAVTRGTREGRGGDNSISKNYISRYIYSINMCISWKKIQIR